MSKLKNEPISIRKDVKKELSFFGVHLATKGSKPPTKQCSLTYERNIHKKFSTPSTVRNILHFDH